MAQDPGEGLRSYPHQVHTTVVAPSLLILVGQQLPGILFPGLLPALAKGERLGAVRGPWVPGIVRSLPGWTGALVILILPCQYCPHHNSSLPGSRDACRDDLDTRFSLCTPGKKGPGVSGEFLL